MSISLTLKSLFKLIPTSARTLTQQMLSISEFVLRQEREVYCSKSLLLTELTRFTLWLSNTVKLEINLNSKSELIFPDVIIY
jgi:hypothetical protein